MQHSLALLTVSKVVTLRNSITKCPMIVYHTDLYILENTIELVSMFTQICCLFTWLKLIL